MIRFFAVLASAISFSAAAASGPAKTPAGPFERVFVVIFENQDTAVVEAQPFFKSLIARGAWLSGFHGVTHPSQPNYVALISGSTQGIADDKNQMVDARNLGDLLDQKGLSWKVYAQGYPGGCFLGAQKGRYVRKHVPFLSFKDVQKNPKSCAKIVNAKDLDTDVSAGRLPAFSLYVPDLDNDAHDTDAAYADRWFKKAFGPRLKDPRFMTGTLVIVTFDEGGYPYHGDNGIYTVLLGDAVKAGAVSDTYYNHYSVLRTIEDAFALGNLGQNDAKASAISGVWKKP